MDRFAFQLQNSEIEVFRWVYPYINSNMYVLLSDGEAVVFDPHEKTALLSLLIDKKIKHVHILLTHEHYDHVNGVNWLKDATGADLFCQQEAADALAKEHTKTPIFISTVIANEDRKDGGHRYQEFKAQFKPYSIKVDKTFVSKTSFMIGGLEFEATSTPGHSPGSACYCLNHGMVFTGDTLLQHHKVILGFRESKRELYESKALPYLKSLAKDTIIMPGHGDPFLLKDTDTI